MQARIVWVLPLSADVIIILRWPNWVKTLSGLCTAFHCSDSGWVNSELFFKWFKFFIKSIPTSRPVLLLLDGHASHV